jgi:hypothetical protein
MAALERLRSRFGSTASAIGRVVKRGSRLGFNREEDGSSPNFGDFSFLSQDGSTIDGGTFVLPPSPPTSPRGGNGERGGRYTREGETSSSSSSTSSHHNQKSLIITNHSHNNSHENLNEEPTLEHLLLESDSDILNALSESLLVHRGDEPAASIFTFYRFHSQSLFLLKWAIRQEFSHRREPREFLSRETLATNILSLFLFDEFGLAFLRDHIKPFITSLANLSQQWEQYDRSSATNHVDWHTTEFLTLFKVFLDNLFLSTELYP